MIDENEKERRELPVQGNDGDEFNFIQLLRLQSDQRHSLSSHIGYQKIQKVMTSE